jgi:hypothetical protein
MDVVEGAEGKQVVVQVVGGSGSEGESEGSGAQG